jgi:hypothetical protein
MPSYYLQSMGDRHGPYDIEFLRQRLAAGEFRPVMPVSIVENGGSHCSNLGNVILEQDGPFEALKVFRAYLAVIASRANRTPDFEPLQTDLAHAHESVGDALHALDDINGAVQSYRAGLHVMESLAARHPRNSGHKKAIALFNYKLAANGDDAVRRYALVAITLKPLAGDLDRKEAEIFAAAVAAAK